MKTKKSIKVTFIDNCSHGYYSVSKKDIISIGLDINQISCGSGMTLTRVYLEEDCDASLFFNKCKELNIEVDVKRTYNPKFKYTHSYEASLFDYVPMVGDIVNHGSKSYKITHLDEKNIIVDDRYRISMSNPFEIIESYSRG